MRSKRLPIGLIVAVALVALVALLATLQYRWLGQVSENERDRLKASLQQSAQEFADDFDRELVVAYQALQPNAPQLLAHDWTAFAAHFDNWRKNTQYPQLIKDVYLLNDSGDKREFLKFRPEDQRFEMTDWPAGLSLVRAAIADEPKMPPAPEPVAQMSSRIEAVRATGIPGGSGGRGGSGFAGGFSNVVLHERMFPSVPAFVISAPEIPQTLRWTTDSSSFELKLRTASIIVVLDREYLRTTMLPDLVARRFRQNADQYRMTVVSGTDVEHPLFVRGLAPDGRIDPDAADAKRALFSLRMDLAKPVLVRQVTSSDGESQFTIEGRSVTTMPIAGAVMTAPKQPTSSSAAPAANTLARATTSAMSIVVGARGDLVNYTARMVPAGQWQLAVQHSAGSLDAAVGKIRRRNLWLSFSILGVLAAGVGLIVINAERSRKLATQQMDFVATVSHELRTPLTVIRSAAQNLSAGVVTDPAQAKQYGDLIETEGRRLTDMVEQVLEYAGLSGNRGLRHAHAVDAAAIARDVIDSSAALFDVERVEVELNIDDALPPVLADEHAVRRALQNLVTNALKYGIDGRWIGVSVRRGTGKSGADDVQMAVSDRGRGIEPEDLPHLFDAFYRGRYAVDRQIHGNGLGLSLVKRIAEAHGGRVTVASTPGQGATFTIHLPAAAPDPAPSGIVEPLPVD